MSGTLRILSRSSLRLVAVQLVHCPNNQRRLLSATIAAAATPRRITRDWSSSSSAGGIRSSGSNSSSSSSSFICGSERRIVTSPSIRPSSLSSTRNAVWKATFLHQQKHLQQQQLLRYFSAVKGQDAESVPLLSSEQRISRSLYRQFLRWCDQLTSEKLPEHILQHLIPPASIKAQDEIDAYRLELLHAASQAKSLVGHDDPDSVLVRRVLDMLPEHTVYQRQHLRVVIRSASELRQVLRALFRLNDTPLPDPEHDKTAYETQLQYQKERRNQAFDFLKHLNELSNGALRLFKQQHETHRDRDGVTFSVGQVVQHQHERWRGVIIDWQKKKVVPGGGKELSDDFSKTTLTTKGYLLGSSKNDDDDGTMNVPPIIQYKVVLDSGDAMAFSSVTGWSHADQSDLVRLANPHLTRIQGGGDGNNDLSNYFDRYDATTQSFIPNELKAYEYPTDERPPLTQLLPADSNSGPEPKLCRQVVEDVQNAASRLYALLMEASEGSTDTRFYSLFESLQIELQALEKGEVLEGGRRYVFSPFGSLQSEMKASERADGLVARLRGVVEPDRVSDLHKAARHVQILIMLSMGISESLNRRRASLLHKEKLKFQVGDIVLHKKYDFRGVIVAWDPTPRLDVTRWDGLQDIANPMEKPFYEIVPDQSDCIEAFGGERPIRYVCEENLEPCPMSRSWIQVDLDPHWERKPTEPCYVPPDSISFQYGLELPDSGVFENCLGCLEHELNHWLYQATNDTADQSDDRLGPKLSMPNMLKLLKVAESKEDSKAFQDTVKQMFKAHPNKDLKSRLEDCTESIAAGSIKKAREELLLIVAEDPEFCEAWNMLGTCALLMGQLPESKAAFQRTLQLNQFYFSSMWGLGLVYFEQKEYQEAADCFRRCLDVDPWASSVATKLSVCIDLLNRVILEDEVPF